MNKAPFNFNKWNTIIGWFTFVIALITYTLTVEPTMSFGIVENILPQLQLVIRPEHLCFKWLVHSSPCLPQIYRTYYTNFLSIFKEINFKVNESKTQFHNAIVILGSSFVGALLILFLIVLVQRCRSWSLCHGFFVYFLAFWLGLREQDMDSPRKSMVVDHFTSYRIIFWSSLYGSLTIPQLVYCTFLFTKQ
jgi:hypothetical protein